MEEPVVTIEQGRLKGKTGADYDGNKYYSFQGIPYAKPPLGKLRFRPPQAPEPWEGIRDATKEGNVCYQNAAPFFQKMGSEDCLYLNVYTPTVPAEGMKLLKPVMVFVHGGAFILGSGNADMLGPEYLLINDVVVVTFNYRLGLLGFLKAEDPSLNIPGNAGLRDVVAALEWVKDNIRYFSGDPKNVTVFGISAGSAAVSYVLLSPLAKGLFHKAILQSGTVFSPWARGFQSKQKLAEALGLNTLNEKEIIEALVELPVEKLADVQNKLEDSIVESKKRPFGPTVENSNQHPFLIEEPFEVLMSGSYNKVPVIIGYCNREGNISEAFYKLSGKKPVHENFEDLIPYTLELAKGSAASKEVADKIKKFYYKDGNTDNLELFSILEGDLNFNVGINRMVRMLSQNSGKPIYYYRLSLETAINAIMSSILPITLPGTSHGADTVYLFKTQAPIKIEPGSPEDVAIRRMSKLWTNFARYSDPNPREQDPLLAVEWKPVARNSLNFLDIGQELVAGENPDGERIAFWDDIYREYARSS